MNFLRFNRPSGKEGSQVSSYQVGFSGMGWGYCRAGVLEGGPSTSIAGVQGRTGPRNDQRGVLRVAYLLELREGTFWPEHKTQWQGLAKAGGASRRAMDVGSGAVQSRALGDAPSSEGPYYLVLQQPVDLQ